MVYVYSKNLVYHEQSFLKDYDSFKEIVLLKSCRESGFEDKSSKHNNNSSSDSARCSSSRSKRMITDYCLCNDFQYFYTQTISTNYNRFDLEEFKELILSKFKAYKRKNNNFIYLIIFEKHKNGAYHLHGVLGGLNNIDIKKNKNGYYNFPFFENIGYNSLSEIRDKIKISHYITKYITKDIVKTDSNISYFHSKGLKLPKIEKIYIDNFDNLELIFENDFVKKYKIKENKNEKK